MRPNFTRLFTLLLALLIHEAITAQVVSVTSSENWSTAVPSTDCNGCIIQISAGVTLTFTTGGQCTNCTFQGGTLSFQSGSGGFGWYSGNTFQNETLNLNTGETFQGGTFSNDSIYINSNLTLETNTTIWNISHIVIPNGVTVTATAAVSVTSSVIALNGNAEYMPDGGALTLSSSQMYLNDSSYISASSALILKNTSSIYVGNGSSASKAYIYYNTSGLAIDASSLIKIQNDNNYLYDWGGYTTSSGSVSTTSAYASSINCGTGYAHSCGAPYVYGCATLNSGGVVACIALALADITLTAVPAGTNVVNLSWSDAQSSTASHYLVQRSKDNGDWTTLATVSAGGYTAGDYQFEDPAALAGTDNYRIARVDQDGAILYSAVSSVTIAGTAGAIGIYPNPVSGHTFYIRTPDNEQLTVNIFTVTGQLLSRQSLQGQMQYQLQLPSQLLPGNAVIVQVISQTGKQAFPLLLQ
jgi:hypothetical protein